MGKLLKYIAEETQGACFTSFKYCYDTITAPAIEYGEAEKEYINLKDMLRMFMILSQEICDKEPQFS